MSPCWLISYQKRHNLSTRTFLLHAIANSLTDRHGNILSANFRYLHGYSYSLPFYTSTRLKLHTELDPAPNAAYYRTSEIDGIPVQMPEPEAESPVLAIRKQLP